MDIFRSADYPKNKRALEKATKREEEKEEEEKEEILYCTTGISSPFMRYHYRVTEIICLGEFKK